MPELGDFMVTRTGGWAAGMIRTISHSTVNHAAVYVGNGLIVEAEPKGAQLGSVKNYPDAIWSDLVLHDSTRAKIVSVAKGFLGTPYNFADIAAQAVVRVFHWKAPKWALKRLSSTKRLQCAQLVDSAYKLAGVQLFADGRPEGLVSPGDLYDLIVR